MILKDFNFNNLESFVTLLKATQWVVDETTLTPFTFLRAGRIINRNPYRVVNYTGEILHNTEEAADIEELYEQFLSEYEELLKSIYLAVNSDYNPIWNTDTQTTIQTTDTIDTATNKFANSNNNVTTSETTVNNLESESNVSDINNSNHAEDTATSNNGYDELNDFQPTVKVHNEASDNDATINNSNESVNSNNVRNLVTDTNDNSVAVDSNTGTIGHDTVLTKTGNIGVTTTQEMIDQEIRLRIKYSFEPLVYKYIEKFLLANIYGGSDADTTI